jgi:predicted metal-dependent phosphoesterase TrpH
MFKSDIHIHTKESSECSNISAKEIVQNYKRSGYNTIIITDHCYDKYFLNKALMKWNDIVEYMCKGYEKAKEEGDKEGINVLFAIELTLKETDSDYLLYGISKEELLNLPYIYNYTLKGLLTLCNNNGYLLIQAHPYRDCSIKVALPNEVHGFEVYNGLDSISKNELSYNYSKINRLKMTSGGDTHIVNDIGKAGIITRNAIIIINDFINCVNNEDYSLITNNLNSRFNIEFNEHSIKDYEDVFNIERDYLNSRTVSTIDQVVNWNNKNKDIHIFVRDRLKDIIVGEITILPLNENQFNKFMSLTLEDTEIEADKLERYIDNNSYYLLFSCIAVSKQYRNNPVILYLILCGFREKINELYSRGIRFINMCAEGQTDEGKKFIESFLNLKEVQVTEDGYKIYSFSEENCIKEFNDWIVNFDTYIKKYYDNKVKCLL